MGVWESFSHTGFGIFRLPSSTMRPGRTLMHPYLVPGEWLVTGRFFDPDGSETVTAGAAILRSSGEFPEILEVSVELRELGEGSYPHAELSNYHLEIVGSGQVRFRMDSIALGTILAGGGSFTQRSLTLAYLSPDRRFVGFEAFTAINRDEVITCGSFLADGAIVKTWEVQLERVPGPGEGE